MANKSSTSGDPPEEQPADDRQSMVVETTAYARVTAPSEPATTPGASGAPALMLVHGYGQPAEHITAFGASVAPAHAVRIAPEGPNAFYRRPRTSGGASQGGIGHGWVADPRRDDTDRRNDAVLGAAWALASEQFTIDPAKRVLLGYSQGVGVATHFARSHPGFAAGLIGLAGGIPKTWRDDLSGLAGLPVLWVTGSRDTAYTPAYQADVVASLRAAGAQVEHVEVVAGHGLLDEARPIVARWLAALLAGG